MAKSGPKKEKPKAITIHQVKRTRRFIFIAYDKGDEVMTVRSNDNPLPSFLTALDELAPLVGVILHLPAAYTGADLRVMGANLATQGGAATVSLLAQKSLDDAGKAFKIVTPSRLLEHPSEEGSYTPPLSAKDKELVDTLIAEAKAYVLGERAQGQLPLEDDKDEDDDAPADNELPFAGDNGTSGKPAKKQRAPVK